MHEDLSRGDRGLAALRELGPIRRDRFVEVDEAAIPHHQRRDRDDHLRRRGDPYHGVRFPGLGVREVPVPAPQVDHQPVVDLESGIDGLRVEQAPQTQTSAGQQDETHCHLYYH